MRQAVWFYAFDSMAIGFEWFGREGTSDTDNDPFSVVADDISVDNLNNELNNEFSTDLIDQYNTLNVNITEDCELKYAVDALDISVEEFAGIEEETALYQDSEDLDVSALVEESVMYQDLKLNKAALFDRVPAFHKFIFLFVELLDLEIDFFNSFILNIQEFVLDSTDAITYFLYSTYSVFGKVPLLPEFHLTVMRTILPYVLRNFLTPIE